MNAKIRNKKEKSMSALVYIEVVDVLRPGDSVPYAQLFVKCRLTSSQQRDFVWIAHEIEFCRETETNGEMNEKQERKKKKNKEFIERLPVSDIIKEVDILEARRSSAIGISLLSAV
ncbi:hypothetical protein CEXT_716191 [Caerostris extrusa]|uniref:Uncharacterized protein n=1 Tax=Caerostris extrusa TaxID=172846 RepID=A0AAV4PUA4_CAEEX|nr:hypothetical protein CEXT_716191 [Caerostris extrusa]